MPNRLPLVALALAMTGCGPDGTTSPKYIGHGGMGAGAAFPMNSAEALIGGTVVGLDGIELDVQLTADSVLVAYHAGSLAELTACAGKVNAMTWEQLAGCPVRGEDDTDHAIVRVDALLAASGGMELTLDVKLFAEGDWWPYLETFSDALVRLHRDRPGRILVECQVDDFLRLLQRKDPSLRLYLYGTQAEAAIRRAATSHYAGITMDATGIDGEQVRTARELGLEVTLFNVHGWFGERPSCRAADRLQVDRIPGR
ncbi:MAG: glycerophosphodiester phosphodiesterase family protein [Flavobacteriales bacterium]